MHFEDRGGGVATIYFKHRVWKRVPEKDSPDRAEWWLVASDDRLIAADREMAQALEYAYQHPETTVPVCRFPRFDPSLQIGQSVFSRDFGFGEIVAINGHHVAVRFGKSKKRWMKKRDLITAIQAEVTWHTYWLRGEKRRLEEGKWLFIVKVLCRKQFGAWQAFLNRYDIPRSTADDLIRRYLDEMARKSPSQQLTGYRSIDLSSPDYAADVATAEKNVKQLDQLIEMERTNRDGREPTHHDSLWSIRIKLPHRILRRCRKKYKRPGAKDYWRSKAYEFVGEDPDEETES